jgi:hypothetical protein
MRVQSVMLGAEQLRHRFVSSSLSVTGLPLSVDGGEVAGILSLVAMNCLSLRPISFCDEAEAMAITSAAHQRHLSDDRRERAALSSTALAAAKSQSNEDTDGDVLMHARMPEMDVRLHRVQRSVDEDDTMRGESVSSSALQKCAAPSDLVDLSPISSSSSSSSASSHLSQFGVPLDSFAIKQLERDEIEEYTRFVSDASCRIADGCRRR